MQRFETEEEILAALKKLPKDKQEKILTRAFELVYEGLDENVYRVLATSIKHAKDNQVEGHEDFQIKDKDLKRLSSIQDTYRHQDRKKNPSK